MRDYMSCWLIQWNQKIYCLSQCQELLCVCVCVCVGVCVCVCLYFIGWGFRAASFPWLGCCSGPTVLHVMDVPWSNTPDVKWNDDDVCYQASPELHNNPFIRIRCVGAGKQAGQWVPRTRVEEYWLSLFLVQQGSKIVISSVFCIFCVFLYSAF